MLGFTPLSGAPLSGSGEGSGDDSLNSSLPLKTLVADDGDRGESTLPLKELLAEGAGGTIGESASPLNLPLKTLLAEGGHGVVIVSLPAKTLVGVGITGAFATLDEVLPAKTLNASGLVSTFGVLDDELPAKALFAYGDEGVDGVLPMKVLTALGVVGTYGALDATLPAKTLTALGITGILQAGALTLPLKQLAAAGWSEIQGILAAELPALRLTAQGESGVVGALDAVLPLRVLAASGYGAITADALLVLPVLQLTASGYSALPATYRTWALNMRNKALTEYKDLQIDSFAVVNGVVLAATPTGIVILGAQALDDDAEIAARVRDGALEYGSSFLKRIPRIYAGIESDGDMLFKTITTEHGARTYLLPYNGAGLRSRRVPVGKGPKSRYWSFQIENQAGSDFSLSSVALYPTDLRRRIQ